MQESLYAGALQAFLFWVQESLGLSAGEIEFEEEEQKEHRNYR